MKKNKQRLNLVIYKVVIAIIEVFISASLKNLCVVFVFCLLQKSFYFFAFLL